MKTARTQTLIMRKVLERTSRKFDIHGTVDVSAGVSFTGMIWTRGFLRKIHLCKWSANIYDELADEPGGSERNRDTVLSRFTLMSKAYDPGDSRRPTFRLTTTEQHESLVRLIGLFIESLGFDVTINVV